MELAVLADVAARQGLGPGRRRERVAVAIDRDQRARASERLDELEALVDGGLQVAVRVLHDVRDPTRDAGANELLALAGARHRDRLVVRVRTRADDRRVTDATGMF